MKKIFGLLALTAFFINANAQDYSHCWGDGGADGYCCEYSYGSGHVCTSSCVHGTTLLDEEGDNTFTLGVDLWCYGFNWNHPTACLASDGYYYFTLDGWSFIGTCYIGEGFNPEVIIMDMETNTELKTISTLDHRYYCETFDKSTNTYATDNGCEWRYKIKNSSEISGHFKIIYKTWFFSKNDINRLYGQCTNEIHF
jgi:hypothetical protein